MRMIIRQIRPEELKRRWALCGACYLYPMEDSDKTALSMYLYFNGFNV